MSGNGAESVDKALDKLIASLPEERQPERDLWPAVRAQLDDPATAVPTAPPARGWRQQVLPAVGRLAAAVALVVGSSLSTLWFAGDKLSNRVVIVETDANSYAAQRVSMDPVYLQARYELVYGLENELDRFSPETRAVVERNLAEIRRGLDEIRAALTREPANQALQQLLVTAYQDELKYLYDIHRLAGMHPRRSDI